VKKDYAEFRYVLIKTQETANTEKPMKRFTKKTLLAYRSTLLRSYRQPLPLFARNSNHRGHRYNGHIEMQKLSHQEIWKKQPRIKVKGETMEEVYYASNVTQNCY